MKHYEFTYLTKADMSETDAKSLQDKLNASITAKNGVITDLPKAYKKKLAYRIKRQDSAFVNTILFQMEAAPLETFKKETEGITEILRGLIVFYKPVPPRRERSFDKEEESKKSEPANETKSEIPAAASSAVENKEKEPVNAKETKKEKEVTKEEVKETKIVKPKRKAKPKAELEDIEEKLEEILK